MAFLKKKTPKCFKFFSLKKKSLSVPAHSLVFVMSFTVIKHNIIARILNYKFLNYGSWHISRARSLLGVSVFCEFMLIDLSGHTAV